MLVHQKDHSPVLDSLIKTDLIPRYLNARIKSLHFLQDTLKGNFANGETILYESDQLLRETKILLTHCTKTILDLPLTLLRLFHRLM